MLTEDEVVDAMCRWLKAGGFRIESFCKGNQTGDDVHAIDRHGRSLFVECKGAVSRSGNPLNQWRNVSGSFFNAVRDAVVIRPRDVHGIAVPDIPEAHELLDRLTETLNNLRIAVFWVSDASQVSPYWPRNVDLAIEELERRIAGAQR